MGKRRFAGSVDADSATTLASRYDNRRIVGHIRGWDFGIKVIAYLDYDGIEKFDIWTTGGSHDDTKKELVARLHSDVT